MKDEQKDAPALDIENSWRNVYWFARMLINSDQYAGIGKKSSRMVNLASALRVVLETADTADTAESEQELLDVLKATLRETLKKEAKEGSKVALSFQDFAAAVEAKFKTIQDVKVFIFTCEQVLIPINDVLKNAPSNDREFSDTIVKAYLEAQGEKALPTVINLWDDIGVEGSLTAERTLVVQAFRSLRKHLEIQTGDFSDEDADYILTAFVQEVERRLAQKRKSRAGGSLEDVTSVILNHFGIPSAHKPDHFQADIEVDKWVRAADGWLIGISCKRTLRERWKQVSSADYGVLGMHKIKQLWHVITYSNDLSEDKLATLGRGKQVFYLPDESPAYQTFSKHHSLADYVRPMSRFIDDLREQTIKK